MWTTFWHLADILTPRLRTTIINMHFQKETFQIIVHTGPVLDCLDWGAVRNVDWSPTATVLSAIGMTFFFFFACLPVYDADPNASITDSPWFHLWSSNGNSFSGLMKKTNSVANKFLMLVYKHIFYLNATLQCNCHLKFFFILNYLYYYLLASSRVLMLQVFKFGVKTITILQQIFHSYKFFCVLCLPTARLMIVQLSRSDSLPVCGWW